MRKNLQKFLPGENTRMAATATFIGLAAGLLNIIFRSLVDLVHRVIFEGGVTCSASTRAAGISSFCLSFR